MEDWLERLSGYASPHSKVVKTGSWGLWRWEMGSLASTSEDMPHRLGATKPCPLLAQRKCPSPATPDLENQGWGDDRP